MDHATGARARPESERRGRHALRPPRDHRDGDAWIEGVVTSLEPWTRRRRVWLPRSRAACPVGTGRHDADEPIRLW